MLAADFLEANFDKVFTHYQKLLHSDNYVTRRQSLKLLGELLLDRHNFSVSWIIINGRPFGRVLINKMNCAPQCPAALFPAAKTSMGNSLKIYYPT